MTEDEHVTLWLPAKGALGGYERRSDAAFLRSTQLAALLGLPYPRTAYWRQIELTEEHKRKLELLAGVHGNTIRKILEVRKEVHHDRR